MNATKRPKLLQTVEGNKVRTKQVYSTQNTLCSGSLTALKRLENDTDGKANKICRGVLENRYIVKSKGKIKKTGAHSQEVSYAIKSANDDNVYELVLAQNWAFEKELHVDDEISLMDVEKDENSVFTVNRDEGYVIVNPDRLFTITSIVGQSWCDRKAAIQESFKGYGVHVNAFRGTIAHLFVTEAMTNKITNIEDFKTVATKLMRQSKIREEAYGNQLSEDEFKNMVFSLIPDISDFVKKHLLNKGQGQKWEIVKVQDIEDNYWSPSFGIKGKIDATVQIKTADNIYKTVPLEFKTGSTHLKGRSRIRSDHLGQLNLYTLMMRSRYGQIDEGILSYIREDGYNEVKISVRDLQALIQARNRLESNTRINENNLKVNVRPEADFDTKCNSCEVRSTCAALLSKENFNSRLGPDINETERKLLSTVSYLSSLDLIFWDSWHNVLTLEADEGTYQENLAKMWKEDPSKRAKRGNCLCNLKLKSELVTPVCENDVVRYIVSLSFDKFCDSGKELDQTFISENDMIILSTDQEICIAFATVIQITTDEIRLSLEDNIAHKSINHNTIFAIDKLISNSASKCLLSNLASIMVEYPHATRLRNYLIRKKQPIFSKLKKSDLDLLTPVVDNLNDDQMKLMAKALVTDSFLFVKGMPGTGKTYSIVRLLQLLVHTKQTVLLVSYTHTAIDNVLLRLQENGSTNFIRIDSGRLGEPELRHRLSSSISKRDSYQEMCTELDTVPIIGTTLLSLGHPIFQRRRFNYCIIDEASQALLPSVFGALMLSDKYIVFGDQDQLPPVIKSSKVKEMKIHDNIFSLMATPMNTVKLTIQYRMNKCIMDLANKLVYKNQMTCSSEDVEIRSIDNLERELKSVLEMCPLNSKSIISKIISGNVEDSIIVLNSRRPGLADSECGESKVGDSYQNTFEADIVFIVIRLFLEGGLSPESIGVIAPYRSQVHLLRQKMVSVANSYNIENPVEVNTVDQYQGREKDIIICSFTRSYSKLQSAPKSSDDTKMGILEDMRRLNVALTRAKKKIILIGDSTTLKDYAPFAKLFHIIPESEHLHINPKDCNLKFRNA